jgi:thiamine biosynthesis lipoprotein
VKVSQTLWDVFQVAQKAEEMTNGLVTPTLLEAIVEAGYDRPFDRLTFSALAPFRPDPMMRPPRLLRAIAVNASARTITLPIGAGLDFGGVAKGWSAHQAMKRLRIEGSALVDAGGDIAISGPRADGSPWQIGVSNPFQRGQEIETLYLKESGVATSGKDHRRWTRNGILQHHIIDPLTGQPAETDLLAVTAVGPDVMQAEAAAKAAFILGSQAGLEWIEAHPEFAALFILEDGQMVYSRKMEDYL